METIEIRLKRTIVAWFIIVALLAGVAICITVTSGSLLKKVAFIAFAVFLDYNVFARARKLLRNEPFLVNRTGHFIYMF